MKDEQGPTCAIGRRLRSARWGFIAILVTGEATRWSFASTSESSLHERHVLVTRDTRIALDVEEMPLMIDPSLSVLHLVGVMIQFTGLVGSN